MKTLPLFYYPSACALVDDNKLLLEVLETDLKKSMASVFSFSDPEECLLFLEKYESPLSKCRFIKNKYEECLDFIHELSTKLDIKNIINLRNNKKRHEEITVIILDYQMPGIDGLEFSKKVNLNQVQKILLTGNANEDVILNGFNQNIIQRFIRKSTDNIIDHLKKHIQELSILYFEKTTKPLLEQIESENKTALSDPVFIEFFEEYCRKNKIQEFYLIDKHGSFLLIDDNGMQSVLLLHTENSLENWLSIYQSEPEVSTHLLSEIKNRKKIPFFGLGKEPWEVDDKSWNIYFHDALEMKGRDKYFFSILKIN